MMKSIVALAALLSIAVHFAHAEEGAAQQTTEQKAKLRRAQFEAAFKAADANGDGGLSKEELAKMRESSIPLVKAHFDSIKAQFDEMDANHDGKVTLEEHDAWVEAKRKAQFEEMDTNHDGVISPEERAAWMKAQRYKSGK